MREHGAQPRVAIIGDSIYQSRTFESRGGLTLLSRKMQSYVCTHSWGSVPSTSQTPSNSYFFSFSMHASVIF